MVNKHIQKLDGWPCCLLEVAICHTFFGAKQWVEPLPLTTQIFLLKNLKNERISRNDCQMRSVQNLFIPLLVDYRGLHYPIHWGLSQYHNSLKRMRFRVVEHCFFMFVPVLGWDAKECLAEAVEPSAPGLRASEWDDSHSCVRKWCPAAMTFHGELAWHWLSFTSFEAQYPKQRLGVQDIVIFVILNCNYIAYIYHFKHVIPMWYYICYTQIYADLCQISSIFHPTCAAWPAWAGQYLWAAGCGGEWDPQLVAFPDGSHARPWRQDGFVFSVVNIAIWKMDARKIDGKFWPFPFFSKMRIWAMNCSFEIHEISPGKNDFMGIFFHSPEDTRHRRQLFLVAG